MILPVLAPGEPLSAAVLDAAGAAAAEVAALHDSAPPMRRNALIGGSVPVRVPKVVSALLGPRNPFPYGPRGGYWTRTLTRADYAPKPPASPAVWPSPSWGWAAWHDDWRDLYADRYAVSPEGHIGTGADIYLPEVQHRDPVTEWRAAAYNASRRVSGSQRASRQWAAYRDAVHPAATDLYSRWQPVLQQHIETHVELIHESAAVAVPTPVPTRTASRWD